MEPFTDHERMLLVVLVTQAWVRIREDPEMEAHIVELETILRKLHGTGRDETLARFMSTLPRSP